MEVEKYSEHKYIIYWVMVIFAVVFTIENIGDPWLVLPLTGVITGFLVLSDIFLLYYKKIARYSIFLVIPLIALLGIHTHDNKYRVLFYLLLYYFFFHYNRAVAASASVALFLLNVTIYKTFINGDLQGFVTYVANEAILFLLVMAVSNLLRKAILQNKSISDARRGLMLKNLELDDAVHELKAAYAKAGEAMVLRERNRMATEVHRGAYPGGGADRARIRHGIAEGPWERC